MCVKKRKAILFLDILEAIIVVSMFMFIFYYSVACFLFSLFKDKVFVCFLFACTLSSLLLIVSYLYRYSNVFYFVLKGALFLLILAGGVSCIFKTCNQQTMFFIWGKCLFFYLVYYIFCKKSIVLDSINREK